MNEIPEQFDQETWASLQDFLGHLPDPVQLHIWGDQGASKAEYEAAHLANLLSERFEQIDHRLFPRRINYPYYPVIGIMGLVKGQAKDFGLRFIGLPSGYQMTSLIAAIQSVSFRGRTAKAKSRIQLQKLTNDYESRVRALLSEQHTLETKIREKQLALDEIHTSRYWRLLSFYWRIRESIQKIAWKSRNRLKQHLPYGIQRWAVRFLAKLRFKTSPSLGNLSGLHAKSLKQDLSTISGLPNTKMDIICFPIIDWDFRFQRPQQLATQFANDGHRCFYIRGKFNAKEDVLLVRNIHENIFDVQLPGPSELSIYSDYLSSDLTEKLQISMEDLRRTANIVDAACLVQLPFWFPLADALGKTWGWKIIYDCMDDHAGFSTNSGKMLQQENELLDISNRKITF